jgi:hypothetical protein
MAGHIKGKQYKVKEYPYPIASLQKINLGRKWKVQARLNDSGYWALYLHLQQYKNRKRKSSYMTPPWSVVIHGNINTRNQDKSVLDRVVEWRNKLELQFMDRSLGLDASKDANKILFKDYYEI